MTDSAQSVSDKPRVLLGLTGSVATIKAIELVTHMQKFSEVRVIVSNKALHFVDVVQLKQICQVYTDEDEWQSTRWQRGDEVLHIELRKWASLFVIAPLSANSLSLLATGGCPSLLLCVARAWDFPSDLSLDQSIDQTGSQSISQSTNRCNNQTIIQSTSQSSNQLSNQSTDLSQLKPLVLAPAMNVAMYQHPITRRQIHTVQSFGPNVHVIDPISKMLACGDIGKGAMAEPIDIAQRVESLLATSTE